MEGFLSGWFPNAHFTDLHRGNVEQWLAWALFDSRWRDLTRSEQAEVEGYLIAIERRLGHTFPDGFNPAIKSMRLTLDPVVVAHRPLIYYIVLMTINLGNSIFLYSMGFRRHPVKNSAFMYWSYTPPPGDIINHRCKQEGTPPIVFVHGLGIGLAQYVHVIFQLMKLHQPLLLVEVLHISSQLHGNVPERNHVVEALQEMLTTNGFSRGIFFGHSYGTIYVAWVIKCCPRIIASAFLVDPIVFLLCKKDVCYNFVYRKPTTWVELVLHYFAGREMHIAKTLSRHFQWSDNVLWAEDLCMRATVVLSEADRIVDTATVRDYLASQANRACVQVVWLPHLHHAEFMFKPGVLQYVVDRLAEHTRARELAPLSSPVVSADSAVRGGVHVKAYGSMVVEDRSQRRVMLRSLCGGGGGGGGTGLSVVIAF